MMGHEVQSLTKVSVRAFGGLEQKFRCSVNRDKPSTSLPKELESSKYERFREPFNERCKGDSPRYCVCRIGPSEFVRRRGLLQ